MKEKYYFLSFPILAAFAACQSETPQVKDDHIHILTVKASLPEYLNTRTHITYGNTDIDKEIFRWHPISDVYSENDFISVFNVTRLSECPDGLELNAVKVDGNTAVFEPTDFNPNIKFPIKAGDVIFVNYYNTERKYTSDDRKIFTLYVGSQANKPQYIVDNPAESMEYMQGNLRMYDIVTATEDDQIPDIHFKHLSAIIRISMRNETGHDIFPTSLNLVYPGSESFFNVTLYCSVDPESPDGSGLKVIEDEFYKEGDNVYTDKIETTVNGKIGTTDSGGVIAQGATYDLYLSTVPRIGNKQTGENGLSINLVEAHQTGGESTYSISIPNFNVAIEAGKRYWFNLTAVEENGERKLMLTNEWLEQHEDAEKVYE